jgi:hypothetical protein
VVAHLSNPSFAWSYGEGDSPHGSGNSTTSNNLFSGEHHAIHEYTLNYVRNGLTQDAITHNSIDPWTWIDGPDDPNRQFVAVYDMPVRIQWVFATGRDYPIWSVTFDLSTAPIERYCFCSTGEVRKGKAAPIDLGADRGEGRSDNQYVGKLGSISRAQALMPPRTLFARKPAACINLAASKDRLPLLHSSTYSLVESNSLR